MANLPTNIQDIKPSKRVAPAAPAVQDALTWDKFMEILEGQASVLLSQPNLFNPIYQKIVERMKDPSSAVKVAQVKAALQTAANTSRDKGFDFIGAIGNKTASSGILLNTLPNPAGESGLASWQTYLNTNFNRLMDQMIGQLNSVQSSAIASVQPSIADIKLEAAKVLDAKMTEYGLTNRSATELATIRTNVDAKVDQLVANVNPYDPDYPAFKGMAGVMTQVQDLTHGPIALMFAAGSEESRLFKNAVNKEYLSWIENAIPSLFSSSITTRDIEKIRYDQVNNPTAVNDNTLNTLAPGIGPALGALQTRSNGKLTFGFSSTPGNPTHYKWDVKNVDGHMQVSISYSIDGTEVTLPYTNADTPLVQFNYLVDEVEKFVATLNREMVIISNNRIPDGTDINMLPTRASLDSTTMGVQTLKDGLVAHLDSVGLRSELANIQITTVTLLGKTYINIAASDSRISPTDFDGGALDANSQFSTGKGTKVFRKEFTLRNQSQDLDHFLERLGDQQKVYDYTNFFSTVPGATNSITAAQAESMFPRLTELQRFSSDYMWSVTLGPLAHDSDNNPTSTMILQIKDPILNTLIATKTIPFKMFSWDTKLAEIKAKMEALRANPFMDPTTIPDVGVVPRMNTLYQTMIGFMEIHGELNSDGVVTNLQAMTENAEKLKEFNVELIATNADGSQVRQNVRMLASVYMTKEQKDQLFERTKREVDSTLETMLGPIRERVDARTYQRLTQEIYANRDQFYNELRQILDDPKFSVADMHKIEDLIKKYEEKFKDIIHKVIPNIPKDFDPKDLAKWLEQIQEMTKPMKTALVAIGSVLGLGSALAFGTAIKTMKFNKANKANAKFKGRGLTITSTIVGLIAASASTILMIYVFIMQGGL